MNTKTPKPKGISTDKKGERGAALVTVMMISFLLLVASIALILESSMNTVNVTDATSEEQAYYAAESGIQSVVSALRHNAVPSPSVDPAATPLPSGLPNIINRLDYRKAVDFRFSNKTCDPGDTTPPFGCTDPRDLNVARLSRWIRYNWGPNGGTGDPSPDRAVLGDPATYSPLNGFAYSVQVSDPDNTSGTVSFTTSGHLTGPSGPTDTMTFPGAGANESTTIRYIPPGPQTINVETTEELGNIGEFVMTTGTAGPGIIPDGNYMVRFKIILSFTQPGGAAVVIRGYILPPGDTIPNTDSSTCARPTVSYLFDSRNFRNFGSLQSIPNAGCAVEETPSNSPRGPHDTLLTGWQVQPAASGVLQRIDLSITRPEPRRLMIRSIGYGPRGARKEFESIIQKNYFDGLGAPSPLTLIGPTCTRTAAGTCTATGGIPAGVVGIENGQTPESQIAFVPGTSNPIQYTGRDATYSLYQPPIGVTNNENLNYVRWVVDNDFGGKIFGTPENIADELPPWLQNPRNIERTIQLLREVAQASGSYYGPTTSPPNNATFGDYASATGITVIDSNGGAELNHFAGGLLVVTKGRLGLRGRYGFRGVMLITGPDGLQRLGGGASNCSPTEVCGRLQGNMIVAPYNAWSLNTCMPDTATPRFQAKLNCFLSPRYDINGGGKSELMGNDQDVANALTGLGNFVKGVAER